MQRLLSFCLHILLNDRLLTITTAIFHCWLSVCSCCVPHKNTMKLMFRWQVPLFICRYCFKQVGNAMIICCQCYIFLVSKLLGLPVAIYYPRKASAVSLALCSQWPNRWLASRLTPGGWYWYYHVLHTSVCVPSAYIAVYSVFYLDRKFPSGTKKSRSWRFNQQCELKANGR